MARPTQQDIYNDLQMALMRYDNMPDGDEKVQQGIYAGLSYLAGQQARPAYTARSQELTTTQQRV